MSEWRRGEGGGGGGGGDSHEAAIRSLFPDRFPVRGNSTVFSVSVIFSVVMCSAYCSVAQCYEIFRELGGGGLTCLVFISVRLTE